MIGSSTSLTPQKAQNQSPLSRSLLAPRPVLKAPESKPPFSPQPSPPGKAPTLTGQSTIRPPQYIDMNTTEDAVNNVLAKGYQEGDQRYQLKQTDRAGLSRGKGNQYMAQQEGVQAMTKAAAEAAGVRAEDEKTNSKMRSDYEKARELEGLNYAMAQHSMGQSNWAAQFAQQQNMLNLFKSLMNP